MPSEAKVSIRKQIKLHMEEYEQFKDERVKCVIDTKTEFKKRKEERKTKVSNHLQTIQMQIKQMKHKSKYESKRNGKSKKVPLNKVQNRRYTNEYGTPIFVCVLCHKKVSTK